MKSVKVTTKISSRATWEVELDDVPGETREKSFVIINVDGGQNYSYSFAGRAQVKKLHAWLGRWLHSQGVRDDKS